MRIQTGAILFVLLIVASSTLFADTYYVNSSIGNDNNSGVSVLTPLASLDKVSKLYILPGDSILLAAGSVFYGTLELKDVNGTADKPVFIGSYNLNNKKWQKPVIDAKGFRNGILVSNCCNIKISSLTITADGGGVPEGKSGKNEMRCGILVNTTRAGVFKNIELCNLLVKDVFYEEKGFQRGSHEVHTFNGTQNYGWGIRFMNRTKDAVLEGLTVDSCEIKNVAHTGIKFTANKRSIRDIKISNNRVFETGGPGIQISCAVNGHVKNNNINYSGNSNDSRKWGRGSGLWTWSCSNVIIEHNSFRNAKGPADSAGCHIDFNCDNVIVQYNVSENNAGGFCEILGNNYNCAYRYNVSINDGARIKKVNGATHEGKMVWLSGYNGKNRERIGPFNSYFYNNTIYVNKDILTKVAVDRVSDGVLITNNIFYIEGKSRSVLGDQYKPEVAGESRVKDILFNNNLFLRADNWPKEVLIQDANPVIGDPKFRNKGGVEIKDYIPENKHLIKNKGVHISKIPGDTKGLFLELKVKYDIMGNRIKGLPDMGAIELH